MSIEKPTTEPIQVRQTPNPNALKFVLPGIRFAASRNYSLGDSVSDSDGDTADDALAARLLTLEGVYNVFLAQDFVTVNKVPHVDWPPLQAAVQSCLADYLIQSISNNAR
ncbi:MAG: NifU N-terminal domain-containing protein [Caldilineaceae bacterium]|nr:NifU N-terminal domain-containing protein [Caldilineaceae bacterium]